MRVAVIVILSVLLSSPQALRAAAITNIGVLGSDTHSGATDVNDAGVVVGVSFHFPPTAFQPPPVFQAFRWTAGDGTQPVVGLTYAHGVNSAGRIVGYTFTAAGNAGRS